MELPIEYLGSFLHRFDIMAREYGEKYRAILICPTAPDADLRLRDAYSAMPGRVLAASRKFCHERGAIMDVCVMSRCAHAEPFRGFNCSEIGFRPGIPKEVQGYVVGTLHRRPEEVKADDGWIGIVSL